MALPKWKQNLIQGYQSFRSGNYQKQKDLYSDLGSHGQNPEIMIISCCDSRADPSDIFHTYPGEIFVLRNVANIVPPFETNASYHGTSSAIEFAVKALKVKAIVVMGHGDCGGIKAYLDGYDQQEQSTFIGRWIKLLDLAKARLEQSGQKEITEPSDMVFAGVLQSLDNLASFPFVKQAIEEGQLSLMGAYFSIIEGKLLFADNDGSFSEVPPAPLE